MITKRDDKSLRNVKTKRDKFKSLCDAKIKHDKFKSKKYPLHLADMIVIKEISVGTLSSTNAIFVR